jgi:hypothetical protein
VTQDLDPVGGAPATPVAPAVGATSRRTRLARLVTEVLAPPCIGAAALVLVGWRAGGAAGLVSGAVCALFVTVLPYAVVIAGVRAGRWSDRMLTSRRQRVVPILSNIAFAAVGLVHAVATDAPRAVVALVVAAIGTQALLFAINLAWKISFHAGVSAGLGVVLAHELGPAVLPLAVPVVLLVCWARVALREHTLAQVTVGAPVGGGALAALYVLAVGGA